ncbi:MAG: class F sortase [Dehalococcoidia bacterium]
MLAASSLLVAAGFALFGLGIYKLANQSNDDAILDSLRDARIVLREEPAEPEKPVEPEEAPAEPPPVVLSDMRLTIKTIDLVAPVIIQGLNADGVPKVPNTGYEATWYDFSSPPGGPSNAIFSGHVTWTGKYGVFWNLKDLKKGDTIKIETGDGSKFVYKVFANFRIDPADPKAIDVMAPTDDSIATLITCGGRWLPNPSEQFGGDYSERVIVQARLVSPSPAGG